MAFNRAAYSQEFERQKKKGKGFAEANKAAMKFADILGKAKPAKSVKKKKKKKESLVTKTARRAKELLYGKKTYAHKKYGPAKKLDKKKFTTARTSAIEKGLKQAGLTEKEIAKRRD